MPPVLLVDVVLNLTHSTEKGLPMDAKEVGEGIAAEETCHRQAKRAAGQKPEYATEPPRVFLFSQF